jgi:hypothetical protein
MMDSVLTNRSSLALALSSALAASALYVYLSKPKIPSLPLPPGPPRLPLIGNANNFPQVEWYSTLWKWLDIYGDVVYANILGQPIVILGNLEAAEELLNKRSNIHSGRIGSYMIMEMWDIL